MYNPYGDNYLGSSVPPDFYNAMRQRQQMRELIALQMPSYRVHIRSWRDLAFRAVVWVGMAVVLLVVNGLIAH